MATQPDFFGAARRQAADLRFLDKALPGRMAFGKGPTRMLERNGALLMLYWFQQGYVKPRGLVIEQTEASKGNPRVQFLNIWARREAEDAMVHAELVKGGRIIPLGPPLMPEMVRNEIANWLAWAEGNAR